MTLPNSHKVFFAYAVQRRQQKEWSDWGSAHLNLSKQMHSLSKLQLVWSDHGSTGEWSDRGLTPSNLSEPLNSLFKEQRERVQLILNLSEPLHMHSLSKQKDCGLTHLNISEPLHSLSKQQREQSDRGSTQLNLSEPLHSLSKQ